MLYPIRPASRPLSWATDGHRPNGAFVVNTEADGGTRTPDPFITSEVLYQLSYVGAGRP